MWQQANTKVIHSPAFTVRHRRLFSSQKNKTLRFVVSGKISKKATDRNKIRRRLQEIWRKITLPPNTETIIYAKKKILELKFSEIKDLSSNIAKRLVV